MSISEFFRKATSDFPGGWGGGGPFPLYLPPHLFASFVMHCPYFLVSLSVKQGREQGYTTEWLPAIATYLNESGRSLEVVFEEYPLKDPEPGGYTAVLLYYNVSLILLHDRSVADFKKVLLLF